MPPTPLTGSVQTEGEGAPGTAVEKSRAASNFSAAVTAPSPKDWPADLKRFLLDRCFAKLREIHGSPECVVEYLYRGKDGVSWGARYPECWPLLLAEYEASKTVKQESAP